MFGQYCGNEIKDTTRFYHGCGKKVNNINQVKDYTDNKNNIKTSYNNTYERPVTTVNIQIKKEKNLQKKIRKILNF